MIKRRVYTKVMYFLQRLTLAEEKLFEDSAYGDCINEIISQ